MTPVAARTTTAPSRSQPILLPPRLTTMIVASTASSTIGMMKAKLLGPPAPPPYDSEVVSRGALAIANDSGRATTTHNTGGARAPGARAFRHRCRLMALSLAAQRSAAKGGDPTSLVWVAGHSLSCPHPRPMRVRLRWSGHGRGYRGSRASSTHAPTAGSRSGEHRVRGGDPALSPLPHRRGRCRALGVADLRRGVRRRIGSDARRVGRLEP